MARDTIHFVTDLFAPQKPRPDAVNEDLLGDDLCHWIAARLAAPDIEVGAHTLGRRRRASVSAGHDPVTMMFSDPARLPR